MDEKTVWCIHHNDLDGRCSAAIINFVVPDSTVSMRFIEVDYGNYDRVIPWEAILPR
jgi:oligoribonuclease NrnB/cAMP/cGMP phosphodiesterase (DHH superfamily)